MTDPLRTSPLVSVILPVYNSEAHLESALQSVLAQDYRPLEIIIVDDGSTDGTADIAKRWKEKAPVRYYYQQNAGPAAARNLGIAHANGELIAFIDADDLWPEHKLTPQVACLLAHPDAALVQGSIERIYLQNINGRNQVTHHPDFPFIYTNLGAMLVRKAVFDRLGTFAVELRYHEDTDFWLRVREAGLPVLVLARKALIYRIHGSNLTTGQTLKSTGFLNILKRSLDRRNAHKEGPQREPVPPLTFLDRSKAQTPSIDYANFSEGGKPRLSVILHISSPADDLTPSIQSILAQGIAPLELILTGHDLSDLAISAVRAAFNNVQIVNSTSEDLADQLNEAITLAQGEWLTFLSTNAVWTEGKLQAQLAYLNAHPEVTILTGHTSPIIDPRQPYPAKTLDSLQLQKSVGDFLDTLIVKKVILEKIGPFKTNTPGMMETDWLLKAKDLGLSPEVLLRVLLYRTISPTTSSPSPEELRSALFDSLHSSIQRKRKNKSE